MTAPPADDVIALDPAVSRGPAPAQTGARRGGTLHILRDGAYDHLDPQRSYTLQALAVGHLLFRTLTMFREDGNGGRVLVGDLAETPGQDVDGDGRTWEFTLKPGIRFEDGREVTAADVAYGIARSFASEISDGPTHLRNWLSENGDYPGPYGKGEGGQGHTRGRDDGPLDVPGLEVRDARTLVLRFRDPHPDLPFAVSQPVTAPVPRDADTRADYDHAPVATGPYRIERHVPGERLTLVRNPHWDAVTDPVRHDHPDRVEIEMGVEAAEQVRRVRADQGPDACAVAENQPPESLAAELVADPSLAGRLSRDPTPLVWYLAINTARVTDLDVRRAIAHALDKTGFRDAMSAGQGVPVHTLLPAATIGHRDYPDPYPSGGHGDPRAAAALLDGATPELRLVSREDAYFLAPAKLLAGSLERAGLRVELVEIDRPSHNAVLKTQGHPYDLYLMCMASDWPGASSLLGMFDGRTIAATGNDNFVYLDDPGINAEIDRLRRLPAAEAADGWAALDERLMRDHVPMVPLFSYLHVALNGSRVRGVFTSSFLGTPVYYNAYVDTDAQAEGGA
ncbi:ABC transporter substrate-binding protein [Streptomyces sp. MUM 203J]|uniref:ABC transporter substrate-binding protein n=1 Tax=Streptomyces sp. MUM 203J TaxID=2791990 RepID=UPI001F03BFAF|nr:ABC transporter substrate-binding protein [Streptomyces sp. MUM 203J]MCH0538347.1 ABC transporter substrate-binding protein [Streptomyces sp. MUM 203J]